ncbi:MAG: 3'-5' exonuclease [Breznakibacter sp.]
MERSITEEEMSQLPLRQFEGKITVVENPKHVPFVVEFLQKFAVIGFDTETKPAFRKGTSNKVALLQLSTNETAFLFRINKLGMHQGIIDLLQDPKITKVGVAVRDDLRALRRLKPFDPQGFVELQSLAKQKGYQDASLKKLAAVVCEFRISKRQRLTNWESRELTPSQMAYAATDAWVSLQIFHRLVGNGQVAEHIYFEL